MLLEVLLVIKELNHLFEIDKLCQAMIIKPSMFKVYLKPYEGESDSILQTHKRRLYPISI